MAACCRVGFPGLNSGGEWVAEVPDSAELEPQVSAELVRRIGERDPSAEEEMVQRYSRGLLYLLKRRTRGDEALALDLRQDTFCVALVKLRSEPLDNPESLAAYLRQTAINLHLGGIRKDTRRGTEADTEMVERAVDDTAGPFENVSREEAAAAVRVLLLELRVPRDREILDQLYLQDQDRDTICSDLDLDAAHFNRVLFRAKGRFREIVLRAEQKVKLQLVE